MDTELYNQKDTTQHTLAALVCLGMCCLCQFIHWGALVLFFYISPAIFLLEYFLVFCLCIFLALWVSGFHIYERTWGRDFEKDILWVPVLLKVYGGGALFTFLCIILAPLCFPFVVGVVLAVPVISIGNLFNPPEEY